MLDTSIESLLTTLGMCMQPVNGEGAIVATMPVDKRTMHPYGMLSGGASIALAESLAGYGSLSYCEEGEFPSGVQVSANHVSNTSRVGEIVTATGVLLHKGRTTHVWNIDITDARGKLLSTVRVTNMILRKDRECL